MAKAHTIFRDYGMKSVHDTIWIAMGVDKTTGKEGIAAEVKIGSGIWPMIEVSESGLPGLMKRAEEISRITKTEIRVVKFTVRELLKVFGATSN